MAKKYDGPRPEEILCGEIVALMESSSTLPPWQRPWSGSKGPHRNLLTGAAYGGSNPILLELGSLLRGHTVPLWLGQSQARQAGWMPKKGSKSVRIVRPQQNRYAEKDQETGEETTRQWVSYKPVPVFNVTDLRGRNEEAQASLDAAIAEALGQNDSPRAESVRIDAAETVLEAWPVETVFGGTVACYAPGADRISMPSPEAFRSRETFVATWAHEQAHSTGHEKRLNRPMAGRFGTPSYAREELVAELASVLICYRLEVGYELEHHASYMASWAKGLRDGGPKELFKVLSEARKAADLITVQGA